MKTMVTRKREKGKEESDILCTDSVVNNIKRENIMGLDGHQRNGE
jgi:hypothetical protein